MRLRATVSYDGTEYHGFQRQANARSVQGELEHVLGKVCSEDIRVIGAGRTDAGVHATGQVIAFSTRWRHSLPELRQAANSQLPADVVLMDIALCCEDFHPRYSARRRTYEYTVYTGIIRLPLLRYYAWHVGRELNVDAMNASAQRLIGEHDFAAFGTAPQGDITLRNVIVARWDRIRSNPSLLRFTIEANAFLFRMVRRIVFVLARTGDGRLGVDEVGEILSSKDSRRVKGIAPACGLCLVNVTY